MHETLKISAVGDIGFHGKVGADIDVHGPEYPFAGISEYLTSTDILTGNLEIPFAQAGERPARRDISSGFRSDPAAAEVLRSTGFGILSLANNHIMDYGAHGLETTISLLDRHGIRHTGAGMNLAEARRPAIIESKGVRFGMLAYAMHGQHTAGLDSPGAAPLDVSLILEDISMLRNSADTIAVSLHFGMIYTDYPRRSDQAIARQIIDSGADVIIGHHPHLIQGIERYGKGQIAYSLGEILFDPSSGFVEAEHVGDLRKQAMILELSVSGEGVDARPLPLCTGEDFRPGPCSDVMEEEIMARLAAISSVLPQYDIDFDRHLAQRTTMHEMKVLKSNLKRMNIGYIARKLTKVRFSHIRGLFRR